MLGLHPDSFGWAWRSIPNAWMAVRNGMFDAFSYAICVLFPAGYKGMPSIPPLDAKLCVVLRYRATNNCELFYHAGPLTSFCSQTPHPFDIDGCRSRTAGRHHGSLWRIQSMRFDPPAHKGNGAAYKLDGWRIR